ncbi:MAG TPA: efflux RND transporter periplasmic adaptor subunit [Acidobacteriaceae bacterium]|nr:efflux RND transporter periplasmic adaptor subunit [Acidobacteriaceae bacterium]
MPFLLFSLAVTGCHRPNGDENIAPAGPPPAAVAAVVRAPLSNTLVVAGEFLPFQEVELHAKVAGYVKRINVDIGDKVRSGQVLATLDIPEITAQVQGADAGVRQTQEQITRAKSEVLQTQANYEALHSAAQRLQQASDARPGLIAQQELDDALARDRAGAAQVDAAKSAYSAMQEQLGVSKADRQHYSSMADYSRIIAPFSGIVTWRYADTGSLIQAGTSNAGSAPVVKIAQVDVLRLRLPVPESLASFVKIGDTASVHVGATGQTFAGKVARNTGELDSTTRSMQVEIDVANREGKMTPDMYADVTLNIQRTGAALVVPVQAVDRSGEQPFVMLVDQSKQVQKRLVKIGVSTANNVEILEGLRQGDLVIVANLSSFQQGEVVEPKRSSLNMANSGNGEEQ